MSADADDRPNLVDGDVSAVFSGLYGRHALHIFRYAASRLGVAAAEDVVGDTFVIALQQRASYDSQRGDVGAWLFGIAANLVRRTVRTDERERRAVARETSRSTPSEPEPYSALVDQIDASVRVNELREALSKLSDGDRDVLLMISAGGIDVAGVAHALGIPPGTVRSRLHRARRQIREHSSQAIDDHCPAENVR